MQVLIAISGFCPRIGNVPCTTPFDFLFVISIHVPTWGTTLSISTNLFALIFQSTFPRGERHHQPGYHYLLHSFQSTFLCGERRHITRMQLTTLHFNPRSRVGNDGWSYSDRICDRDFNPHSCVGNDTKCEKKLRSYPGKHRAFLAPLEKINKSSTYDLCITDKAKETSSCADLFRCGAASVCLDCRMFALRLGASVSLIRLPRCY